MKQFVTVVVLCVIAFFRTDAQVTIEQCLAQADENYPLLKRYGLISKTQSIALSDINKQWLPSVGVYGQATVQNRVAEFPEALTDIMAQMGREMRGLGRLQYKVGIDVNQTIWDGGNARANRQIARAERDESEAALDVQMYAMHEKVISLFFAILLTDKQIEQQQNAIELLEANRARLESMYRAGAAMKSDVDNMSAQILLSKQRLTQAQYAVESYRKVLSIYVGEPLEGKTLVVPEIQLPADMDSNRPELKLFDARINTNASRMSLVDVSLMPRVSAFAQTFYGYPGFNNFESMMNRRLSFNIIAGLKVSWTLNSLYTKKNSIDKLRLANEMTNNERDTFLYNSRLQVESESGEIEGMEKVIVDDESIIGLLADVRKAAESQLEHGVIDTVALLTKITDETQARMAATYHAIRLLQLKYQLKYTLNR